MTTFKSLSDRAVSTLAGSINSVVTSLSVASGEGALFPASNFWVTIGDEIMLCSSRSVDTLTVTRGVLGTSGAAHTIGDYIALNVVSQHFDDITAALNAAESDIDALETNPVAHASRHQNGGADEISVAGLSGLLADDQHVLDTEVIAAVEAGTLSTVNIDGGTINGITDLAVVDGGTGSSTAAGARTNLGVGAIGELAEVTLGTHTGGNYVADITAGALIDVSGGGAETATITVAVDLSELTDMTGAESGTDELVILDSGVQKRKAIGEINLSSFNNDSGFLTSVDLTADVTGDLPVADGGTGVGTLTGHLKGNGTSAITGSTDVELASGESVNINTPLLTGGNLTITGLSAEMLAGGAIGAMDAVCIHTVTKEIVVADASVVATARAIGFAPSAISDTATGTILLQGFVRNDTWNWTTGGAIYLSETSGSVTQTAPTTSGAFLQVVGVALSPDVMYFNPSMDIIELA